MRLYKIIRPLIFCLPAELAHRLTVRVLSTIGKFIPTSVRDDYIIHVSAMGLKFSNPFGMAAGFDKNGELPEAVSRLGFGFTEIGTVTPQPQEGNPPPRIFRLTRDEGIINRLGFNNEGHQIVRARLASYKALLPHGFPVGVNIGANKDSPDRIDDYRIGAEVFSELADYLTINVSSPNTPGLRDLQTAGALTQIITQVKKVAGDTPVFLKVAPDLKHDDIAEIAKVALKMKPAALIVSNTTIDRDRMKSSPYKWEEGGLSGRPLMQKSTEVLRQFYRHTKGELTLIGVGGVSDAAGALEKIKSGASLIQLYTALVYQGPGLIAKLKRELADLLREEGFASLEDAIGVDVSFDNLTEPKEKGVQMKVKILHNPRCTKSRQTLALLEEKGTSPEIVEYLKTPLTEKQIKALLKKLDLTAREAMRTNEKLYKELSLAEVDDEAVLIKAMSENPILIERPIVETPNDAAIGRPPENVLPLLSV
ncbi:MAG: dihydroorotate dehydrogenase (quinone) [Rhodobiaceae bacterium]|nr:dihydroorotate dehydrogenase (quinone) [Rhodobiaceae bacterium]